MSTTYEIHRSAPARGDGGANGTGESATASGATSARSVASQLPFALAIFLSAFLLFQVQLLLGKEILPLFGGAPAVWTACVFVFQLLFLAGYAYSHAIATWLSLRRQFVAQGALLVAAGVLLAVMGHFWSSPIRPGASWHPLLSSNPTWVITQYVICAIGLPFFLLSATSPLLQHWFASAAPHESPYRLYSLSNAGSLLGLLSYPFLVEPHIGLRAQGWGWAAGYAIFLACYLFTLRSASRSAALPATEQKSAPIPRPIAAATSVPWSRRVFWTALAACASILLLATTNLICQNITVSPFLWVLELSLYLISFIICFENDRWYRRDIFYPLLAISVALVISISLPAATARFMTQLAVYSVALFAGCMVCHGEAARTRPASHSLTMFYLCIATGGALGGGAVSLLAPRIFPNYWEFPIGVLGCIAVVLFVSAADRASWWHTGQASLALLILAGVALLTPSVLAAAWKAAARWPSSLGAYAAAALVAAAVIRFAVERRRRRLAAPGGKATTASPHFVRGAARIALALLTAGLVIPQKAAFYHVIASSRNFYGVLSVVSGTAADGESYLVLRHGNTVHGLQYQDPQRARIATGYYGPNSGANIVISNWPRHPMRVGLVGMGIGTLAALARPGDVYRFYEINPDVYTLASPPHGYFTYLRDSPGEIQVVLGDGRISLQAEADRGDFQKFDVLVLDAFTSDAIPMHLLTREAFAVYVSHLRAPSSVIAVHISNQTLDLRPVLAGIAREFRFHAVRVYTLDPSGPFSQSDWVLLSRDPASLATPQLSRVSEPFVPSVTPLYWTDDYCDLLHVIRWRN